MNYGNPLKRPEGGKIKVSWPHASSHLLTPLFFNQFSRNALHDTLLDLVQGADNVLQASPKADSFILVEVIRILA